MIKWSWILLFLIISCKEVKQKVTPLTFVEKSLLKDSVNLNLPVFEHGLPFIENDSTDYLNIYLINDSVVQVNGERFEGFDKLESSFLSAKYVHDKKQLPNESEDYESIDSSFIYFLRKLNKTDFQINIFCDTSIHYGSIDKIFAILLKIVKNSGRTIHLLDINSTSIEVRHSTYDDSGIIYCGIRNYLEILINYQNQLMVEGKWDQTLDSIPVSIIDWYLDKNQSWGLDKISSKICQHEISMLTNIFNNQGGSEQILEQINYWNKRLEITRLIGSYETTPRYYSILIQGDNRTKIINYFRILDKINQGVLELRNSLNLEKFDIEYANLNLNLNKELKMKEAIDEVYPVLINPLVFYPRIPPPPPPNPPKGYKVNECYW